MTKFCNQTFEIVHRDFSQDCICSHNIWSSSGEGEQNKRGAASLSKFLSSWPRKGKNIEIGYSGSGGTP